VSAGAAQLKQSEGLTGALKSILSMLTIGGTHSKRSRDNLALSRKSYATNINLAIIFACQGNTGPIPALMHIQGGFHEAA
jgi:hypothetical protein